MKILYYNNCNKNVIFKFAVNFAFCLNLGVVVYLQGNLGTGKTFFSQCLIKTKKNFIGLVKSPTYTLLELYNTTPHVYHFDLYMCFLFK